MIKIASDKEKFLKILHELEILSSQGKISKSTYETQKKQLNEEMETFAVAERVKRLQGKEADEETLDYFVEKNKSEKDFQEREKLLEKYVTPSETTYNGLSKRNSGRVKRNTAIIAAFLALIFFAGIGLGFVFMKGPSESAAVQMLVNDSAFPAVNSTNVTNTSTTSTTSTSTPTTTSTQSSQSESTTTDTGTSASGTGSANDGGFTPTSGANDGGSPPTNSPANP